MPMWVRSSQLLNQMSPAFISHIPQQLVILTAVTLGVYDVRLSKLIECLHFDARSLISPSLSSKANGAIPSDCIGDLVHSMRVYKGKIFLLVSSFWSNVFPLIHVCHSGPGRPSSRNTPNLGRSDPVFCPRRRLFEGRRFGKGVLSR